MHLTVVSKHIISNIEWKGTQPTVFIVIGFNRLNSIVGAYTHELYYIVMHVYLIHTWQYNITRMLYFWLSWTNCYVYAQIQVHTLKTNSEERVEICPSYQYSSHVHHLSVALIPIRSKTDFLLSYNCRLSKMVEHVTVYPSLYDCLGCAFANFKQNGNCRYIHASFLTKSNWNRKEKLD